MIVRLDDFPTGVRPILKDLSLFFKIFDEFEKRKIVFYVGIVPELLEKYVLPKDIQKLKNYKYLIVCQHGYNHRYDEFSKILIEKNDYKNNGTIGVFNEFENCTKQQILNSIKKGKDILENIFNCKIKHYIPVCDFVNQSLLDCIIESGFKYIFTTNDSQRIIGIEEIRTQISCKLSDITNKNYNAICLHPTWEIDFIENNGWNEWLNNFNKVFKQKENIIPKIANFYFNSETPLSYLRYMTFATFRHFNPEWKMILWRSKSNKNNLWNGNYEQQDFQKNDNRVDYTNELKNINVEIIDFDVPDLQKYSPVVISDYCRWRFIEKGGWFFDTDQIFTRSFNRLNCYDFVIGGHRIAYIGVVAKSIHGQLSNLLNHFQVIKVKNLDKFKNYNEFGIELLIDILKTNEYTTIANNEKHFFTPNEYFYPIYNSNDVHLLYEGVVNISELVNNYAVHWYGGHQKSQRFNQLFTPQFAQVSQDSISIYLRKIGVVL